VPGLVLGILGGLCLAGAVALCYAAYGLLGGTAAFSALAALGISGFFLCFTIHIACKEQHHYHSKSYNFVFHDFNF